MSDDEPTLIERLGFAAADRALIVNCDDIGSSHAANLACLEAMDRGWATSATLMVPCPWALEAASLFSGRDVGVHLTLTAEYPTYRWRSLTGAASLHDDHGYMPATVREARARANLDDARRECRAQIEQALAWGIDVTHLDSHMGGAQTDPRYLEIYLDLASEFRLPLRMVSAADDARMKFRSRRPAADRALVFPDTFIAHWGEPTEEMMRRELPALGPGVAEIMLHPALDGPELRGYDLTQSHIRIHDHGCAINPAIAALIAAEGIHRIGYRPLRDLQRAGAPVTAR
jgi:hypothetical protein